MTAFRENRDALSQILADLANAPLCAETSPLVPAIESDSPGAGPEDDLEDAGDFPTHEFADDELNDDCFDSRCWQEIEADEACIPLYRPL